MGIGQYTINEIYGVCIAISVFVVSAEKIGTWILNKLQKYHKEKTHEEDFETDVKRHDESIKEIIKYQKFMGAGIKELLRYRLIEYHKEYIIRGFIYVDELDYFNEMYDTYKMLGGNSTVTRLHDEVLNLEVRPR